MRKIEHAMKEGAHHRAAKALAKGRKKGARFPSSRISSAKAREVLKHGEVHGHKLTPAQRGMFGAAAGRGR